MPGSPRNPRTEFAVGVWRSAAFAAAALAVCAGLATGVRAEEPDAKPNRLTLGGLLGPFGDFVPGGVTPPPPPAPFAAPGPDVGRAEFAGVATASAKIAYVWNEAGEEVSLLRGSCVVSHGGTTLLAREMVLWRRAVEGGNRLGVYLNGDARLERAGKSETAPSMILDLDAASVEYQISGERIEQSQADDPVYRQAVARRKASAEERSHSVARPPIDGPVLGDPGIGYETVRLRPPDGRLRRVRIFPRSSIPFDVESIRSTNSIPPEQITVITGGVNVLIDGFDEMGLVDLSADRVVIWTQAMGDEFQSEQVQTEDTPYTVYLEGNVSIRQGDNWTRAERAVYEAREQRGLVEHAELRSFIPELGGDIRVRADQLRILSNERFQAFNAWTTTSTFGKPGYRIQSREIFVEPRYDIDLGWLGVGSSRVVDPATGMEMNKTNWVRGYNNTVYVEDVPIFYSPYVAGPAEDVNIPIKQFSVGNDQTFGFRVKTAWDVFDLFGADQPPGVQLNLLADYFSKRGPGGGLDGAYFGEDLFGIDDRYRGTGIGYFVHDEGLDRLGQFRRDLPLDTDNRWRLKWRHRHELPMSARVQAELGVLSDYNFLEQYFEREFDADKDQENLLYATQTLEPWGAGNWGWEALGQARLNDFETTTGWYPKGDLWGLSEPLFDGWMTWSSHTQAGYGDIDPADPTDYRNERFFDPLYYAPDVEGGVFMTRHELDMQLPVGPFNIVPFAMGEAAAWGEGIDGSDLGRLTGSAGTRASIQFQRTYPEVYSRILGLNGLAHKIRLEAEYRLTDTTQPLGAVAQYNEFDDNAQERLRYRLPDATFRGVLPPEVDPRIYGVRSGVGTPLGSPYYELVEDQQVLRLAARQRLQTKAGPPGRMRIRDWMTFDTGVSLFPNPDRDNFGQTAGLLFADYGWLVSERTKLLANAQYDFFDRAPRLWSLGFISQRSARGSIYLGLRHIEASPLISDMLIGSYSYVMSPKWISTLAASVDVHQTSNTAQAVTLTRVGSDFLVHLGVNANNNIGNYGFTIAVEPRIGNWRGQNTMQLSSLLTPTINP